MCKNGRMMTKPHYTKAQARQLLGAKNDAELARKLGVIRQAVSGWGGDDDPIPEGRAWQVRAIVAEENLAR